MRVRVRLRWTIVFCVVAAISGDVDAQRKPKTTTARQPTTTPPAEPPLRGPDTKEGAKQATKAAKVLNEIMATPDKGIPEDLLDKCECVAVVPGFKKGGLGVGGRYGKGVVMCRRPGKRWSAGDVHHELTALELPA